MRDYLVSRFVIFRSVSSFLHALFPVEKRHFVAGDVASW